MDDFVKVMALQSQFGNGRGKIEYIIIGYKCCIKVMICDATIIYYIMSFILALSQDIKANQTF